jgi:hypothetical protein
MPNKKKNASTKKKERMHTHSWRTKIQQYPLIPISNFKTNNIAIVKKKCPNKSTNKNARTLLQATNCTFPSLISQLLIMWNWDPWKIVDVTNGRNGFGHPLVVEWQSCMQFFYW